VATALLLRPAGSGALDPDFDGFAEHVAWLAAPGCHGVTPNGSLGEYRTLTADERARVVITAVAEFHLRLLALAGNAHLVEHVRSPRVQLRIYGLRSLAERGELVPSAHEHAELLDLVTRRAPSVSWAATSGTSAGSGPSRRGAGHRSGRSSCRISSARAVAAAGSTSGDPTCGSQFRS
jgi:hypothetical protein